MNKDTHYTPEVEEFHPGFECEHLYKNHSTIKDGWHFLVIKKDTRLICWEDYINEKRVRVKYLDREDIESQNFMIQHSMWDRESLKRTVIKYVPHPKFDSGAQFEKVINETLVWQIFWNAETGDMIIVKAHNERKRRLVWSEPKDKKEKTPPKYFMEFDERFKGIIKNKSEFKRILKQTGIVK